MTIIMRNSLFLKNRTVPRECACYTSGHPGQPLRMVTWAEVLDARRAHQREILRVKRDLNGFSRRALWVHVWYNPFFPFEGWHCYLLGAGGWREWVRNSWHPDPYGLMALFPVRLFPVSFDGWKPLFAASHTCKMWHGRPVGKAYVWATFHGSRMDTLRA